MCGRSEPFPRSASDASDGGELAAAAAAVAGVEGVVAVRSLVAARAPLAHFRAFSRSGVGLLRFDGTETLVCWGRVRVCLAVC
jgi:hypothetical protein